MKNIRIVLLSLLTISGLTSFAQKSISDATLTYEISIQSAQSKPMANDLNGSSFTLYLKGALSRTDMVSSLGNEKTIRDGKSGNAVILKEYSGQKLMITLSKDEWEEKNKKKNDIVFTLSNESKTLIGYNCSKATATLKDGSILTVYYTKDLIASNKDYDPTFRSLPGLPLQYEFETAKLKFIYIASKIDFNPVPASKFEFPKSGYRVMTFSENKQGKKDL